MKKILYSILNLILISNIIIAQETELSFGLGVSLNPTAVFGNSSSIMLLPVGFSNFYIPITLNNSKRIEPEFGIYSYSSESTSEGYSIENSSTITRLGLGLLFLKPYSDNFNASFGLRIGLLSHSTTSKYNGETSSRDQSDLYIGIVVGGEHMLSEHFSIGGEIQLNYIEIGEEKRTPSASNGNDRSESMITNNALLFFRWYY